MCYFEGLSVAAIERFEILPIVIYQTAVEIMNAVSDASFSNIENKCGYTTKKLQGVLDPDTFIQPGMGKAPFIGDDLESSIEQVLACPADEHLEVIAGGGAVAKPRQEVDHPRPAETHAVEARGEASID